MSPVIEVLPAIKFKPPVRGGLSFFLTNLVQKKVLTPEEAQLLATLPSPHQQFEAVQRFRAQGGRDLAQFLQEFRRSPNTNGSPRTAHKSRMKPLILFCLAGLASIVALWQIAPAIGQLVATYELSHSFQSARPVAEALPSNVNLPTPGLPPVNSVLASPHPMEVFVGVAPLTAVATPAPLTVAAPAPVAPHEADTPLIDRHLMAELQPTGAVHLRWDADNTAQKFLLYSATREDLSDRIQEDPDTIPVNWYEWMPAEGRTSVWLSVRGILSNGNKTRLSRPVHVQLPDNSGN